MQRASQGSRPRGERVQLRLEGDERRLIATAQEGDLLVLDAAAFATFFFTVALLLLDDENFEPDFQLVVDAPRVACVAAVEGVQHGAGEFDVLAEALDRERDRERETQRATNGLYAL